ncbi:MAG: LPP20 family lipoprotein [Bacteroidota bacterium]
MQVLKSIVAALFVAILLVGCGGSQPEVKPTVVGDVPEWWENELPSDPNTLFARATAESQSQQFAINKAKQDCMLDLSQQMESNLSGLTKKFAQEVGTGGDTQLLEEATQVSKSVTKQTLVGAKEKYRKASKDGNKWVAYVLVELPLGAAKEALAKQIQENKNLYTRFQASQSFKELEQEMNKMEEKK